MNYRDGQPVMVGDVLMLDGDITGTVVCSIDDKRGTPEFPIADWEYLGRGIMVESPQLGLLHIDAPDSDLVLVTRREI